MIYTCFRPRKKKSLVLRPRFSKKEGRAGGFFFLFSRFFLLNSLVKFHEEEFDGDMLFVLNITG